MCLSKYVTNTPEIQVKGNYIPIGENPNLKPNGDDIVRLRGANMVKPLTMGTYISIAGEHSIASASASESTSRDSWGTGALR